MTTECNQESFEFHPRNQRPVVGGFDGGAMTRDAGGLLLREVEKRTGIIARFAGYFRDHGKPELIEHRVRELVAQRVYGRARGYEDLNDHEQLRADPLLAVLAEKAEPAGEIVLDLDATDDPVHGNQEGRFFHGYYGHYNYWPLYIFCGDFLLCARLRPSNIDAAAGCVEELERIVGQIRQAWPQVKITVRGDAGFCREALMAWCEQAGVDYVLGLAKNERLKAETVSAQE